MNRLLKYCIFFLLSSQINLIAKADEQTASDLKQRFHFMDAEFQEPRALTLLRALSTEAPGAFRTKGNLYCRYLRKDQNDDSRFFCLLTDAKDHPLNASGERIKEHEAKKSGVK